MPSIAPSVSPRLTLLGSLLSFDTVGTAAVAAIDLGAPGWYLFRSARQVRSAGTAANHQPMLSTSNPPTATDAPGAGGQGLVWQATSAAVASPVHETLAEPEAFYTSSGLVYYAPGFDAGADNGASVEVKFSPASGGRLAVVSVT